MRAVLEFVVVVVTAMFPTSKPLKEHRAGMVIVMVVIVTAAAAAVGVRRQIFALRTYSNLVAVGATLFRRARRE